MKYLVLYRNFKCVAWIIAPQKFSDHVKATKYGEQLASESVGREFQIILIED